MEDRFNTTAGWVLFSGVVALGLSTISSHYFMASRPHRPEKMGYAIAGVQEEGASSGPAIPLPNLLAKADPAKGEQVFKKCASCHTINQGGANGIGPNLYGVVGEAIGQGAGGYAFSDAIKALGGSWDFAKLNEWLTNPKKMAPGTKMTFAGLPSAEDRANVIVYLNSQGSNKPLPAVEAAPAAGASAAAGAAAGGNPGAAAAKAGAAASAGGTPAQAAGEAPSAAGSQAALPVVASSPKPGDNKATGNTHDNPGRP